MSKNRQRITYASIAVFTLLLNVTARYSRAFCGAYIKHVLPVWVNTYGRLMGLFPFSVGEFMIGLALLLVGAGVVLSIFLFTLFVVNAIKKVRKATGTAAFVKFAHGYYTCLAWILLISLLAMTLNGFIMYHGVTFAEMYFQEGGGGYALEELIHIRNFVVKECVRLSGEVTRDAFGNIVYDGDIKSVAIECMQALGEVYPRLEGYYPPAKPLIMSDFHCQQYIQGYFFPFSMEATYNDVMYIMNKPAAICHELAHLKGYILEDEANFIGFLACINSEDVFFQYSGYLSVLNYLDNDFYRSVGMDKALYMEQPEIPRQVAEDNVFVTSGEWERIEGKAWFKTEDVDAVTDVLMDANLKANGVQDGMLSYSRVVGLVMQYYRRFSH